MNRRNFIKSSGLAIASTGLNGINPFDKINSGDIIIPKIKEFRRLGRTGFLVSDIGCGTPMIQDENLLRAILDRGINYIDTAYQYYNGNSERMVGRVIKGYERESLFITTKIFIPREMSMDDIISKVTECNTRIDSGYIDCIQMHAASSIKEINNPKYKKAIQKLKRKGIIRFCGVSCHGQSWYTESQPMDQVLDAAINEGFYDLFLLVYNYVQREMAEYIINQCKKNDIAITLMKTNPFGGFYSTIKQSIDSRLKEGKELTPSMKTIHEKFTLKQEKAASFLQKYGIDDEVGMRDSAVKFVLNNPNVHSVLVTFQNFQEIDDYVRLSGQRFEPDDSQYLTHCKEVYDPFYCRHACGICESACPHKVPVNTIMRYYHYFSAQQRKSYSTSQYQNLENNASNCLNCSASCQDACPYGVQILTLLKVAHTNLSI